MGLIGAWKQREIARDCKASLGLLLVSRVLPASDEGTSSFPAASCGSLAAARIVVWVCALWEYGFELGR